MKKSVLLYGLVMALLVVVMKLIQYQYLIRDLSIEFYIGIVALIFTGVGIWSGWKLTQKKGQEITKISEAIFTRNETETGKLGISRRELEVLQLMASGMSNQEIADTLFVSLNTVKTHSANLFIKLEAKRRTQAVHRGKELGIIP